MVQCHLLKELGTGRGGRAAHSVTLPVCLSFPHPEPGLRGAVGHPKKGVRGWVM